jgi:hypothetical protein
VSAAIKNALNNLDKSIDKAEGSLVRYQKALKARVGQNDLFSAPTRPVAVVSTGLGFDRNMLAKKLDMTITRVEQLLGEV